MQGRRGGGLKARAALLGANHTTMVLVAAPGSPAAVVLELVSLAYHHPATESSPPA